MNEVVRNPGEEGINTPFSGDKKSELLNTIQDEKNISFE